MSEINAAEVAEESRQAFQDLKDEGFEIEGSITLTRTNEDTGEVERVVISPAIVDTPDFEEQIAGNEGSTGHDPDRGTEPPVEENSADQVEVEFDEDNYTSHTAQEKADAAGLSPDDIDGRNDDGKIRVSDVEDQIKSNKG